MNYGTKFEATLANSWVASSLNLVRMKITETGEEKPCDERVDTDNFRIFNELKSTGNESFKIREIKKHQMKALFQWDLKFKDSASIVSIEFRKTSTAYIVSFTSLIKYVHTENLSEITPKNIEENILHYKLKFKNDIYVINADFLKFLEKCKEAKA